MFDITTWTDNIYPLMFNQQAAISNRSVVRVEHEYVWVSVYVKCQGCIVSKVSKHHMNYVATITLRENRW